MRCFSHGDLLNQLEREGQLPQRRLSQLKKLQQWIERDSNEARPVEGNLPLHLLKAVPDSCVVVLTVKNEEHHKDVAPEHAKKPAKQSEPVKES